MSRLPIEIDDEEMRELIKRLSPRQAAGAIARAVNQTLQTMGVFAQKELRNIGVSAKAAKPQWSSDEPRGGMIVRSRVSVKNVLSSGNAAPEITFRQGRRANIGLISGANATAWTQRNKQVGVKAKLNKIVKFKKAFFIKRKVFWRRNGKDLEPIVSTPENYYKQSAQLINSFASSLPPIAAQTLKKRAIENLTFLVNKQNASDESRE